LAAGAFAIDLGNDLTIVGEVKAGLKVDGADDSPSFDPDEGKGSLIDEDDDSWIGPTKAQVDKAGKTEDTRVSLYNNDADRTLRTRLTLNYDGEWGGGKIRFHTDNALTGTPSFPKAYGWGNFLGKKIVVYGGKGFDDLWGLGKLPTFAFDPSLDGITGVRFAFNVVEGVSFGFGLPLDQISYVKGDNKKFVQSTPTYWDGTTPGWASKSETWYRSSANRTLGAVFGGLVVGGLYKSDFLSAAAGLKLNPAINSKDYGGTAKDFKADGTADEYYERPMYVQAVIGVAVNPIEPLSIGLDVDIDTRKYETAKSYFSLNNNGGAQDHEIGYVRVGLQGEYAVSSALAVSLTLDALFNNEKAERDTSATTDDPFAQYIDKKKPETKVNVYDYVKHHNGVVDTYIPVETYGDMSLGFELGGNYTLSDTFGAYLNIGSDNLLWIAGDVSLKKDYTELYKSTYRPGAGFFVKPGVVITLGGANIEIFDKIAGIGATDLQYYYQDGADLKIGKTSPVTNQFQIDFNWVF
jgi:hypothetical protein